MRNFLKGIKNLIYFFPVIWKFRGWDHAYTERILYYCLKEVLKEQLEFPYYSDKQKSQRRIRKLKEAIYILKRLNQDSEVHDYIERKYGPYGIDLNSNHFKLVFERPESQFIQPVIEKELQKEYKREIYQEKDFRNRLGECLKWCAHWWT